MPFHPKSRLAQLLKAPVRPGTVQWIGLRLERRGEIVAADDAHLSPEIGLIGDHYQGRSGNRHLTLIGQEDIHAIASFLGVSVQAHALRRNVVTSGINLLALKDKRFRLGKAVLEYTGECHPCSRMEEIFGVGGYNAVRGRGGITARVIEGGRFRVGDRLIVEGDETQLT
ncbi:MOSC domain-containing protein [Asticcacaulis sp. DXS10W]|uniref:MOSC domain-containing protein n=1 Tax=Asticcacaulis currens TaxID=2984210 RepID=A0ABT5ID66_9CAUL|nr:MOSC domain-containing protein [Asticcacaulis currens]MDC7693401.1 MOSC domain-containing protein [Asticcacaulis currens]